MPQQSRRIEPLQSRKPVALNARPVAPRSISNNGVTTRGRTGAITSPLPIRNRSASPSFRATKPVQQPSQHGDASRNALSTHPSGISANVDKPAVDSKKERDMELLQTGTNAYEIKVSLQLLAKHRMSKAQAEFDKAKKELEESEVEFSKSVEEMRECKKNLEKIFGDAKAAQIRKYVDNEIASRIYGL